MSHHANQSALAQTAADQGPFKAWHFWTIMGALFAVVFIVNGLFVYFALTSWTGVEEQQAYERGLAYNEALARAEHQKALGWTADVTVDRLAGEDRVRLSLTGPGAAALTGARVEGTLRRPTQAELDRTVTLEEAGPGVYQTLVDLPARGVWDLRLHVHQGEDTLELRERIILP
ncbi:MAG: FixH family protein [Alphaproteobacteria bacterium]